MRKFNKMLAVLLCICCIFSVGMFSGVEVMAASGPTIEVDNITAVPLDTVTVNLTVTQNPGTMAMTFTISYNPEVLTFKSWKRGFVKDYTVIDHPDKGYVSFVNCEFRNSLLTGRLISLEFDVKKEAPPGFHEMKIRNIRPESYGDSMSGCFANWKGTKMEPVIINGGITIGKTCNNVGHSFGEWKTVVEPTCILEGQKSRSCKAEGCGHTQNEAIPMTDHVFDDFWTIDRAATAELKGVMSRHCNGCDKATDKVYFSLPESAENNFTNAADNKVQSDSWDKLQSITDKNNQQSLPPVAEPGIEKDNNETSKPWQEPPADSTEVYVPDDATQLVETTKKQSDGIIGRLYRYFNGDENSEGLISIIKGGLSDSSDLFGLSKLIISIFLFLFSII